MLPFFVEFLKPNLQKKTPKKILDSLKIIAIVNFFSYFIAFSTATVAPTIGFLLMPIRRGFLYTNMYDFPTNKEPILIFDKKTVE